MFGMWDTTTITKTWITMERPSEFISFCKEDLAYIRIKEGIIDLLFKDGSKTSILNNDENALEQLKSVFRGEPIRV